MDRRAAYHQTVLANIERTGMHLTGVFGGPGREPPFVYSTGLHRSSLPDLIVFSLPGDYAMYLMNTLYQRAKAGVLEFKDGVVIYDPELMRYPCMFKDTDPELVEDYATGSYRLSLEETGTVNPVLQLVWTDTNSRYPWDKDFDPKFDGKQQKLWVTRN